MKLRQIYLLASFAILGSFLSMVVLSVALRRPGSTVDPGSLFDKLRHDFGVISPADDLACDFTLTNRGKPDLLVRRVDGSCGCMIIQRPQGKVLSHGRSEKIRIQLSTASLTPPTSLAKIATVSLESPDLPAGSASVELAITAQLRPLVTAEPPALSLERAGGKDRVATTFAVRRGLLDSGPFQALRVQGPSYYQLRRVKRSDSEILYSISADPETLPERPSPIRISFDTRKGEGILSLPVELLPAKAPLEVVPRTYFLYLDLHHREDLESVDTCKKFIIIYKNIKDIYISSIYNKDNIFAYRLKGKNVLEISLKAVPPTNPYKGKLIINCFSRSENRDYPLTVNASIFMKRD